MRVSLALLALLSLAGSARSFITIKDQKFVDENCNDYVVAGYNTWQMLEAAAGFKGSPSDVTAQLDKAVEQGLNTVRAFAFGTEEGFGLQKKPGQYDEATFKALDFVLDEARKRGLRLVLAVANNWPSANTDEKRRSGANTDNKFAYADAVGAIKVVNGRVVGEDAFFTDPRAKQAYKDHLSVLANRVNSINGRKYKDDPTIMSWNLVNEPRCEGPADCGMQGWIQEMAGAMKRADPNHLVTVGADGFYAAASCLAETTNPYLWAGYTGNDFLPNHAADGVDYAAIHLWPDNWRRWDPAFGREWLDGHIRNAQALGKPLLLEEFGKAVGGEAASDQSEGDRSKWFNQTYSRVRESVEGGEPLRGVLFWRWGAIGNGGLSDFDKSASITTDSAAFRDSVRPFSTFAGDRKVNLCGGSAGRKAGAPAKAPAAAAANASAVATASMINSRRRRLSASSGPGPSFFAIPTPEDAGSGCNAAYGRSASAAVKTVTANSVADCCKAAKAAGYAAWSYCYCDNGCTDAGVATVANVPKGSCQFKSPANPFYAPADAMGSGVGWISGSPGAGSSYLEPWKCQPKGAGSCSADSDPSTCSAADLRASVKCAPDDCKPQQVNVDGNLLVFDINSATPEPTILTAADCCAACRGNAECTAWTFCPLKKGCAKDCKAYIAQASPGKGFGPYGSCQGDAFPFRACSLKAMPQGKHATTASGPHQPWVSGVIREEK